MEAALLGAERAALQHHHGTIAGSAERPTPPCRSMPPSESKQFFIQGITSQGRTFRPSDWAERLAGVMSSFRPGGAAPGAARFIGYSPYCVPRVINGIKCVIVDERLRGIEPMAWDFVMHFARDNDLQVAEACLMPGQE
jgi:Protein of unknown function (DUF3579)